MQIINFQRDLNWHLSNIIEMYWFIDTIGTFQPILVAIPSIVLLSNGPELALHRHDIENKKNMHKFHTLQCKNNKLLLSNHHLLWCNIYTLWGSSSSVCDDEHFVLKIHKLLFDFVFRKYASCNHPLKNIQTWATLYAFSMSFVNAT